ncbi:hypothetical protein SPSYN_00955 [Sporotomaculum syntrophicum]|uniref:Uncharacterized protein n=1 Tax=Sporotomaculum syntrophicum TaxID=182264 RepID=A0A9D2WRP8_9FIRM|nr:hypothetical protein SPSYN_00955 [Sporotomaculum syntrophicum]
MLISHNISTGLIELLHITSYIILCITSPSKNDGPCTVDFQTKVTLPWLINEGIKVP